MNDSLRAGGVDSVAAPTAAAAAAAYRIGGSGVALGTGAVAVGAGAGAGEGVSVGFVGAVVVFASFSCAFSASSAVSYTSTRTYSSRVLTTLDLLVAPRRRQYCA